MSHPLPSRRSSSLAFVCLESCPMAPRPSCLIVSSLAVLLSAAFACGAQVPRPGEAGLSPAEAAQLQAARDASAVYSARIPAELAATGDRKSTRLNSSH